MKLKYFNKLLEYSKSGKLPLILLLSPFFLDGKKKNLEILRQKINYSIHKTLKRKYMNKKIGNDVSFSSSKKKNLKNPIWFMWLQGIEDAPELCKVNFNRISRTHSERMNLITADTLEEYLDLPEFILKKWKKGIITNTHFSDIVRVQLLATYGGTWVDSTAFVSDTLLEFDEDFLIPQTFKPGRDGNVIPVSSWYIHAGEKNEYMIRVRDLLFYYWQKHDYLIDYFLLHHFLIIASEEMQDYLDCIKPLDNTLPHLLMLRMRRYDISKDEFLTYFKNLKLMKFTNKAQNEREKNNYNKMINLLKGEN
ncbi:glycosyl transferase [Pediococcus pentosaceus]|uniref:capsular polysaccharide synthesis protein n=1 Tax=Pediococcus pentosaceus TaxID=1255 RepID=UPI0021A66DA5|nr:capsular polysaccharide synthesis protein [Pediococcus pentosaceus]MCT3019817.1 glycosyl transferase [Pediococcus pentosaceus]